MHVKSILMLEKNIFWFKWRVSRYGIKSHFHYRRWSVYGHHVRSRRICTQWPRSTIPRFCLTHISIQVVLWPGRILFSHSINSVFQQTTVCSKTRLICWICSRLTCSKCCFLKKLWTFWDIMQERVNMKNLDQLPLVESSLCLLKLPTPSFQKAVSK